MSRFGRRPVAVSWSSGKDAAWTLHRLRERGDDVRALITTITRDFERVSIHGVRRSLLRRQALLADLPLIEVELPFACSNQLYEFAMSRALDDLATRLGIRALAFGDLFLPDVRAYRERLLEPHDLEPLFPLWGTRTDLLARQMLGAGLEARIAALDPTRLDPRWAGAAWDLAFLDALPSTIDPCGEHGEFHTFVTDGPMFTGPLTVVAGEIVTRDGVVFADFSTPPAAGR